ncbi:hypothetical protein [Tenacibaculum sp. nBUS_03]|uniref:hypothetical protein n=1 Tax=Tenacibaculum sp. nBUS_03 TaxID=3395320 RepID=UPI003EBBA552
MSLINKQISFILFFFTIFNIPAQQEKIYYGSPSTRGAELRLKDDNTYKIITHHGKHGEIDTGRETVIYIDEIGYDVEGFNITEDYADVIKDSINVHFYRRGIHSDYDKYFIGYKPTGDKKFTYINLSYETLLFNTEKVDPFGFTGFLSFKIPRTSEIQFILEDDVENNIKEEKYFMNQFSLSANTANVYVDFREIQNKNNPYNSKFAIATIYGSGKKIFDIKNSAFSSVLKPSKYVKRTKTEYILNWKIPSKVKKEVYKKFSNHKYAYEPIMTIGSLQRNKDYEKHEFTTLSKAITAVKADKSKVLLVFNSLLNHNDIAYFHNIFDKIYSTQEKSYLSDYHFDKVFPYYIKPADLRELQKYRSESNGNGEVFALDSDLNIIYTENITTEGFYYKYSGLDKDLVHNLLAISKLKKFKRNLNSKRVTAKDFLDLGNQRNHYLVDLAITKRKQDEDDIFVESTTLDERNKTVSGFENNTEFFYPKIDYQEIRGALDHIVKKHKEDTAIDFDYAKLAFDFITTESFFEEISGEKGSHAPTKIYYEFCLYLSRFSVEPSKIYNQFSERYKKNQYSAIREILKSSNGEKSKYPELVTAIYENLHKIESEKYASIFLYYIYLYNIDKLNFEQFDVLINEIAPLNDDFNQQVESFYKVCECPYIDEMKYHLTILGNAMAWKAVSKNNTNKKLLQKALKWSKLANELSPENHYYLDTYANLEYFLNNKKRALELEYKAIQLATDSEHKNLKEYQKTLNKMKLNTLKY